MLYHQWSPVFCPAPQRMYRKKRDKGFHVLFAFAQRGKVERYRAYPAIEVFLEFPLEDRGFYIPIGCADEPGIHLPFSRTARRSLAWRSGFSSPISSRKRFPQWAG
jgi:hypothetical protein